MEAMLGGGALLPLVQLSIVGLLPPRVRAMYGFPWDERRERVLRLSGAAIRGGVRVTPSVLRYFPAARRAA